jgi:signal peptidase I
MYQLEVDAGKHDKEIYKEFHSKKKKKGGLLGIISSYLVLLLLSGLFVTGVVYKICGENFKINGHTALVIKTGSMSDFYNDEIAAKYDYDTSLHFNVGDICVFEKATELVEGEVYGYKYKNIIITHRLVAQHGDLYEFRGDNNAVSDGLLIKREDIVYHYNHTKIPGIGAFVLYAQSIFGIWSLTGIIAVLVSSEVVIHKIDKINKARDYKMTPRDPDEKPVEKKRGKKHAK